MFQKAELLNRQVSQKLRLHIRELGLYGREQFKPFPA